MWKCKNCSEQIENNFNSCWKCNYSRNGSPPQKHVEVLSEAILPNGQLLSQVVSSHSNSSAQTTGEPENQEVVVVGVNIPFMSLVFFMVKLTIAAIPATLIVIFLVLIFPFLLGGVFSMIH